MADILLIEDESILAESICALLGEAGHDARYVITGEEGLATIRTSLPDVILLDLRLPRMDGTEVLRVLRREQVSAPVVVMTAHGTIDIAVEAMKLGASEFLTKPLNLDVLLLTINRVLDRQRVAENLQYFQHRERAGSGVETMIGASPAITAVREQILRLARSPALRSEFPPSVLITGETGCGKDLVARAIHYEGPRAEKSFVHVNCTAVPDELFEAELFGHVKGAFTSAVQARKGLMEIADGGTIFLDEVGHLKSALQSKLLTAIEHKKIRPVGASVEHKVDIHVISATNRDLEEAIAEGQFRSDFYHRLRVVPFHLSPLRERPEDIGPLAEHFVALYSARIGAAIAGIDEQAMALLRQHDWPGNVREMAHALESAVLMCDDHFIRPEHLAMRGRARGAPLEVDIAGRSSIVVDFERGGPVLDDLEYAVLEAALALSGHNLSRAARMLGITREAVRYRLEKHRARHSEAECSGGE